jgi:hypothetical protein
MSKNFVTGPGEMKYMHIACKFHKAIDGTVNKKRKPG